MRVGLVVASLLLLSSELPAAQEPPSPPPPEVVPRDSTAHPGPARGTCFRGRPRADCGSFFLTEWSWVFRTAGVGAISPSVKPGNSYLTWQVGWMRNVSPR